MVSTIWSSWQCADEAEAALPFMQLAIARTDVALDPVVFQAMPIAPGSALDRLIHVAVVLGFRDLAINGDQVTTGQDAKDSKDDNPALSGGGSVLRRQSG